MPKGVEHVVSLIRSTLIHREWICGSAGKNHSFRLSGAEWMGPDSVAKNRLLDNNVSQNI
jgi:hypothetical protein